MPAGVRGDIVVGGEDGLGYGLSTVYATPTPSGQ